MSDYFNPGNIVKAERLSRYDPGSAAGIIRAWLGRAPDFRKAAILLTALSTTAAARIFRKLGNEEMERLAGEIAGLEMVVPEIRERVIEEFRGLALARLFARQGNIEGARAALGAALGTAGAG